LKTTDICTIATWNQNWIKIFLFLKNYENKISDETYLYT